MFNRKTRTHTSYTRDTKIDSSVNMIQYNSCNILYLMQKTAQSYTVIPFYYTRKLTFGASNTDPSNGTHAISLLHGIQALSAATAHTGAVVVVHFTVGAAEPWICERK